MTAPEIPIWVAGQQLWVTGVDRKTTVSDVVQTVLGHADQRYSIVEKWRRVERPLNGDTRILKLWKTWGEAKTEVKLSLKKVPADDDSGRSSPVSTGRRRKHRHKSACSKYGQTVHPRRLAQLSKTQNIERLLKLILVQGETIQNQILRLKERENQIEELEGEQHKNRVNVLGTNYLLETYLGGCEEKEDSGVATEQPSSENTSTPTGEDSKDDEEILTIDEDVETEIRDLRDRIHLLEKITKANKRLEKEEENLVRLYINIERCKKKDAVVGELRCNVQKLRHENEQRERECSANSKALGELETVLGTRKCYLQQLLDDFVGGGEDRTPQRSTGAARAKDKSLAAAKTDRPPALPAPPPPPPPLPPPPSPPPATAKVDSKYCSLPSRDKPVLNTLV